jgi:hypothetical protein
VSSHRIANFQTTIGVQVELIAETRREQFIVPGPGDAMGFEYLRRFITLFSWPMGS